MAECMTWLVRLESELHGWLDVVVCVCNLTAWRPGGGNCRRWDLRPSSAHVDRASALSTASIWGSYRRVESSRSPKAEHTGPGGKPSSQKFPRGAVAG